MKAHVTAALKLFFIVLKLLLNAVAISCWDQKLRRQGVDITNKVKEAIAHPEPRNAVLKEVPSNLSRRGKAV
jgi:hypothetical protein